MQLPEHLTSLVENLPNEPGVYRFRDHQGRPLYVGKSRTLRDRVRTYFRPEPSDRKVAHLRARTRSIDFLVLESDWQAREVEWDLIRSDDPAYNTVYRDYWNRPYVKLTVEDPYPKIELTQTKEDDGAEYYGPFRGTRRLGLALMALRETFPVRNCDLSIAPGGERRHESCFEADLGRCTAPCVGRESVSSYEDRIDEVRAFLEGDGGAVVEHLRERMQEVAGERDYEAAALYRDRLEAVKNLQSYEPFVRETLRADVVGFEENAAAVLHVRGHRIVDFQVFTDAEGPPPHKAVRRLLGGHRATVVTNDPARLGEIAGRVQSPGNEEERRLLRAARLTARRQSAARHHQSERHPLVETVTVNGRGIRRDRSLDDTTVRHGTNDSGAGNPLKSLLVPAYHRDLENGRPLPDRVRVDFEVPPDQPAPDLWSDVPFWIPVHTAG